MRFRLRCTSAITLPTTIVTAASHQSPRCQRVSVSPIAIAAVAGSTTRAKAANAAALTAVAMNAVIGSGAPS